MVETKQTTKQERVCVLCNNKYNDSLWYCDKDKDTGKTTYAHKNCADGLNKLGDC